MSRFVGLALFVIVPVILFSLAGLIEDSYILTVINVINPVEMTNESNPLWQVLVFFTTLSVGALVVAGGIFGKSYDMVMLGIVVAFAWVIIAIIRDYAVLFTVLAQVNTAFAILVVSPFLFMITIITIEWLRGRFA